MSYPFETFGDRFNPKHNAIGLLRLILALLVIIQHSFALNGINDPLSNIGFINFGAIGVYGFFILSGFLITASWTNTQSIIRFTLKRVIRIFPAFWMCLILTTFLGSFLILKINGTEFTFQLFKSQLGYISNNVFLIINQPSIGGLTDTLQEKSLNGSLWTLAYEFLFYMLLGFAGLFGILKHKAPTILLITIYIVTYWLSDCKCTIFFKVYTSQQVAILPYMFGVGVIFNVLLNSIIYSKLIFLASVCLFIIDIFYNKSMPLYPFFLAYILLWLSINLPLKTIENFGDFSYGIYIYHFPIIQIILLTKSNFTPWMLVIITIIPTFFLAFLSWNFIEKPALRLKILLNKSR
ncbi:acyltransferase family protein [Pedobacter cryotolerans]|uniref:Acyltransferase n=1 Tax=Pedobacter cryotolerans TaxID=2571270 RepID=A0A4U1BZI7_9SPHI|nr:acyltransferase [Pedobacter cryotolerans]TKB98232.1 acyltransferase [Pedobacter cryotolerans]